MKIKAILKKVFAPRKEAKPSVKVALPSREEWLASLLKANSQAVVDFLQAVEDFANSPDSEGDPEAVEAYERMVDSAKALGFPEVEDFKGEMNMALVAAMEYHCLRSDTLSDTNLALSRIAQAVKAIDAGEYTFLDDVSDDEELGGEILQRIGMHRDFTQRWDWLLDYVNTEELGKATREDEGGIFTEYGYFQYGALVY